MLSREAQRGRTFVIRLEDGEILHEEIERFARENHIQAAALTVLGGADAGSVLICGPEEGRPPEGVPVKPMESTLGEAHEITGTGTLFPDSDGNPSLHMHISAGREGITVTGCVRRGIRVWNVVEIILTEILSPESRRSLDKKTGFELLIP
ncbi:MAG: PPC domain-containing DNA-binding protein [Spirochaetia bacterium]